MADLSDVEQALVNAIALALYPSGATPGQASIAGPVCKIYRGWPIPTQGGFDQDLAKGIVNISVFTESGAEKNTTRCETLWQDMTPANPQITLSAALNVVTLGGSIQAGDFCAVKIGLHDYFPVPATGSLAAVAAALTAAIAVKYPGTTSLGNVINIATSASVLVAAGGNGTAWKEVGRQSQCFQITAWCPTAPVRDTVGTFIKNVFADVRRIVIPSDNSWAMLKYQRSIITDKNQTQQSYRRDLFYTVEFATSVTGLVPSITVFAVNTQGGTYPTNSPIVTTVA